MANQYTNGWTPREEEILLKHLGTLTFEEISRKLKKSVAAIEHKVEKMGLGNTQAMSGMINVHHLAWILNVDDKTIYRWIKKYDFPIHKKNLRTIGKRPFNFVDIDEFWKWAEKHQENINWFKVEPMVLLPEPEWVKLRRKEDFYKKSTRKNWSKKEDQKLWLLYYTKGLTQKQTADMMGRTVNSVEKG